MPNVPYRTTRWRRTRLTPPTAVETTITADSVVILDKPTDTVVIEGWRGGRFRVYSNGADDETATITFYAVEPFENENGYMVSNIGTLAITLGTEVGVAGAQALPNHRFADTMTWTSSTFFTALQVYVGGNVADVDPAANAISDLMVSDFGGIHGLAWKVTTYGLTAARFIDVLAKFDV
jgi:hypothetical protein